MLTRAYHLMASARGHGLTMSDTIMVNVWFQSSNRQYELDRNSTVLDLRKDIAKNHDVPLSEVKILLGGCVLSDSLTIQVRR